MFAVDPKWAELSQKIFHDVLLWVGFGTLAGLTAKAIMPGRDPGGAVGTLLMGVVGTVIGCGTLSFFDATAHITPISFWGFIAGTAGAFTILAFFRLLSASVFSSLQNGVFLSVQKRTQRRRASSQNFL